MNPTLPIIEADTCDSTMARARQLEAEEEENLNGAASPDEETVNFLDEFQGGVNRRANDEISLFENTVSSLGYRDEFSDDGPAYATDDNVEDQSTRHSAHSNDK